MPALTDPGPPQTIEVAEHVFAYIQPDGTWFLNNAGFVVGDDQVVLVDTCATERRTRALLDAVAAVTEAPIQVVVNTHHHGDHTHGNYLVPEATVVAQRSCRDEVERFGIGGLDGMWGDVEWGDLQLRPADETFEDELHLTVGDLRLEILAFGTPAHTISDSIVWLPDPKVLYAGDLVFNGGTPFAVMGSINGSLDALDWIRAFEPEVVVPGHGPVCGVEALEPVEAYLRFVLELAEEGRAVGISPLEVALDAVLGPFSALTDEERLVANLHRAYADLDGIPGGDPIDYVTAFADMLTLNLGRPLRCLA